MRVLLICLLFISLTGMAGDLLHHKDPETGIFSWQKVDDGFSIRFIQLLPD